MCGKVIASVTRHARKQYQCEACSVPIPPGFDYVRVAEADDSGKMWAHRWHIECRAEFDRYLTQETFDDCGDPWHTWENDMPVEHKAKYVYGPWEQRQ